MSNYTGERPSFLEALILITVIFGVPSFFLYILVMTPDAPQVPCLEYGKKVCKSVDTVIPSAGGGFMVIPDTECYRPCLKRGRE